METIDDIIIKTHSKHIFTQKQGSLFWPKTYRYESSDGLQMRSLDECEWHMLLSREGIYHTYEPNISRTRRRPDFGIGSSFLLEVCSMVDTPLIFESDSVKSREYKETMRQKREIFNNLNYNLIEVYPKFIILNNHPIKNVNAYDFVIGIVKNYNASSYQCKPRIITCHRLCPA